MINKAIIEAMPGRYFSTVWFIPGEGKDFMGALWRDGPAEPFHFTFRFRYYQDDRVQGSEDLKSSYQVVDQAVRTEEEAAESIRKVINHVLLTGKFDMNAMDELVIQSDDVETIMMKLAGRPWCHIHTTAKGGDA